MAGLLDALFQGQAPAGLLGGGSIADALSPGRERRRTEELRKLMAIRQLEQSMGINREELELKRQQFQHQKDQANRPVFHNTFDPTIGEAVPTPYRFTPNGVEQMPVMGRQMPQVVPGQPVIPPPPIGGDAKKWRMDQTEEMAKTSALRSGGARVLGLVDQIEKKTNDPMFKEAIGPFSAEASEQPLWSPMRLGYEALQSKDAKTFLGQVRQDANALDSIMQRELLKGQGVISDPERAAIAKIKGEIAAARSPEHARQLLGNFRGVVRNLFQLDDNTILQDAQKAIAEGRDPKGVAARLKQLGVDPKKAGL
jgi:hypothetical protein